MQGSVDANRLIQQTHHYLENLKLTAMALSVCHLVHLKGRCCLAQRIVAVIVLQTVGLQRDINMIYSHFL